MGQVLAEDERGKDAILVTITPRWLPDMRKMARNFRNLLNVGIQVDEIGFKSDRASCVKACHCYIIVKVSLIKPASAIIELTTPSFTSLTRLKLLSVTCSSRYLVAHQFIPLVFSVSLVLLSPRLPNFIVIFVCLLKSLIVDALLDEVTYEILLLILDSVILTI